MSLQNRVEQSKVKAVPADWYTLKQWCRILDKSPTHTGVILRQGIAMGIVQMHKFHIMTPNRGLYPTQHYKELFPDDPTTPRDPELPYHVSTHFPDFFTNDQTPATQTLPASHPDRVHRAPAKPPRRAGQPRRQDAMRQGKAPKGA